MASATAEHRKSSTAYFRDEFEDRWADLDHPLFYYDPEFEAHCLDRLAELERLEAGWDHEGAPRIDPEIIKAVGAFVCSLPAHIATRPMVVPLSSGGVQLEWHHGRQVLELEFENPETVHYLKWDPGRQVEEEAVVAASDKDKLVGLVRWFMKGMLDG